MRYSPAVESVPLLRPWALLLALVVVIVVLALSYQSKDVYMPHEGEVDAVSAGYAELLLNADPENTELRADLVSQLIQLGEFSRARDHLQEWRAEGPHLKAFYELLLDANVAIVEKRESGFTAIRERLANFDHRGFSPTRQAQLTSLALALGLPGTAADIEMSMANAQSEERNRLLVAAAQHYLEAGQQRQAAQLFALLASEADSAAQAQLWAWRAYDSLLSAADPGEASAYLLEQLDSKGMHGLSQAQWQRSISLAQGAQRLDLAERLAAHWEHRQPDSTAALHARFDLQLAAGSIEAAWKTGQRLLVATPSDASLLQQMALLAQWRDQPERALEYWLGYLYLVPDEAIRNTTWRLAFQLFHYDQGIDLLLATAATRRLTDEELNALIYAQGQRGTPAEAEQWLRGYLRSGNDQRLAWSRLLQNLQNTLQPVAEADAWEAFSDHYTLTTAELVSWAEVLWNLYQPERAWHVLNDNAVGGLSSDYWRLRAALAWELGRESEVQSSYEHMLAQGVLLSNEEQRQLIEIYQRQDPERALRMLVEGWQRTGDSRYLTDALPLAEDLLDWALFKQLLAQASSRTDLATLLPVRLAQARLAEHEGRDAEAESLYLQALDADPSSTLLRQRLLWLYVGGGQKKQLATRVQQWEPQALNVASLWLVMAAANQSLGRSAQALQWYDRHIRSAPNDLLALAASADALEDAGRYSSALQLRTRLLPRLQSPSLEHASLNERELWARLMAAAGGRQRSLAHVKQWQDGSVGVLQLWYTGQLSRLDETNQTSQKDAWLAWGRARGLTEAHYHRVQEALRRYQRDALTAQLDQAETSVASRVASLELLGHESTALAQTLSHLGDEQPLAVRQQLRRQALALTERYPQGLRVGWQREDFGALELQGLEFSLARFTSDNSYARLDSSRLRYHADVLNTRRIGTEQNVQLGWQRPLANGEFSLALDHSERADEDRTGLTVTRRWQHGGDALELGLGWHQESRDTGLMRALGQKDSVWAAGQHSFTARDQLSWMVAQRRFDTRSGRYLASGQQLSIDFSQVQFFSGPTWVLRTGLELQRNSLTGNSLSPMLSMNGGVVRQPTISATDLLPERVGRAYIGSQLRRGLPGALNRTRGQYTWLLDTSLGWDWEEQSTTFSITSGIGIEMLGDDELAFTAGYQSAPIGGAGDAGGTATLSYSSRFGR